MSSLRLLEEVVFFGEPVCVCDKGSGQISLHAIGNFSIQG
jgi:hypothetical protein